MAGAGGGLHYGQRSTHTNRPEQSKNRPRKLQRAPAGADPGRIPHRQRKLAEACRPVGLVTLCKSDSSPPSKNTDAPNRPSILCRRARRPSSSPNLGTHQRGPVDLSRGTCCPPSHIANLNESTT